MQNLKISELGKNLAYFFFLVPGCPTTGQAMCINAYTITLSDIMSILMILLEKLGPNREFGHIKKVVNVHMGVLW